MSARAVKRTATPVKCLLVIVRYIQVSPLVSPHQVLHSHPFLAYLLLIERNSPMFSLISQHFWNVLTCHLSRISADSCPSRFIFSISAHCLPTPPRSLTLTKQRRNCCSHGPSEPATYRLSPVRLTFPSSSHARKTKCKMNERKNLRLVRPRAKHLGGGFLCLTER